jgi:predicted NAD/FAD-binding protein
MTKVAIIGTGISGLAAAHRLKDKAELTVFEADRRTGGHANTVVVESERGFEAVDTGFIVFNDRNYPEFTAILEEMEVASRPSTMSFSYSDGDFEYTGRDLNGLFARRRNIASPSFIRMLAEFTRFQRSLRELVASGESGPSLDEFLDQNRFSKPLRDRVVVPLVAAVWSADPQQMSSFPVGFLARFLDNHGLLGLRGRPSWRTIEGGSWQYVEALTAPIRDRLRTNTPIESVRRFESHVEITPRGGGPERFDEVVIATHSDQALRMLADPSPVERELLGAIAYQPNHTVLHSDDSVMPRRQAAWACWNYRASEDASGRATLTYDMNRLQTLPCKRRFLVSLNMTDRIDPALIHAEFTYDHPVFTPDSVAVQERWAEISGPRRTHFCGAYWRNGFHEDGAFSGLRAARAVEARLPGDGTGAASSEVPSEWA